MKVQLYSPSVPVILAMVMALVVAAGPTVAQAPAALLAPEELLEVQLDDGGVATKFINPLDPVLAATTKDGPEIGLRFFNTTGDRTFIVSMPFTFSALELASAYALGDEELGQKGAEEIVCAALKRNGDTSCSPAEHEAIRTRERLRILYEVVSGANPTSLGKCGGPLKQPDCIVETLFWRAACQAKRPDKLREFARQNGGLDQDVLDALQGEANEIVKELLEEERSRKVADECSSERIRSLQETVDVELGLTPNPVFVPPAAAEAKVAGLKARFAAERVLLAKNELRSAIEKRMTKEKEGSASVLQKLEKQRLALKKGADGRPYGEVECRRRELEAAAKLLTSYSLSYKIPYKGVPKTLVNNESCDAIGKSMTTQAARTSRAQQAREQGVEFECRSDAATTTCSATATIPPYQYATFPARIIARLPKKRVAFNVSFFGETEVPANANGYVIRPGAAAEEERPDSAFAVAMGGDASTALDPNDDVTGHLRHTGGSGTLSFLYTGAVEASATLQFKQGDFGGPADTNKIEASQYQGKVFGHKPDIFKNIPGLRDQAISLQYGRLPFAKPSSGIAVNVFGEGLRFALGPASVAYVVLRESDNLKDVADTQNDDSSLWIFQIKNAALRSRIFRTFDFVALRGEDRRDQEKDEVEDPEKTFLPIPFDYWSAGGEIRWGWERFPAFGFSLAAYYSERDVDPPPAAPPPNRPLRLDGQGWTALARASWNSLQFPRLTQLEKGKPRPALGASLLLGYGTGDDKKTPDEDEGYLGEKAGFSNDVLFLSRISQAFPKEIGSGLANKWYGGAQLTDAKANWLARIPRFLGVGDEEIASTSTIFSLHAYRFVREVEGLHWAGAEADLELNVEAPKNIRWSLGGAYYFKSEALEAIGLDHDLWAATAKLTLGLSYP